jgi:hypothetical protein
MKQWALVVLFSLWLMACNKDDKGPTKTEMLTSTTWKYDNGGIDQNHDGTVDFTFEQTGVVQPCMLDNTGKFNADGTGMTDEGSTKCTVNAPQTLPFNWSFANNEAALNISGTGLFGLGGQFKVNTLTETQLGISKDTTVTVSGLTMTVTLIANLKH